MELQGRTYYLLPAEQADHITTDLLIKMGSTIPTALSPLQPLLTF